MRKFVALLATLLFVGGVSAQEASSEALQQLQKLNRVYRNLNGLYVDSVDMAPLVEEAIRAMIDCLDPHSAYLTAEEMRREQASFAGEFCGIGVEVQTLRDTLRVMQTLSEGGARRAGVRAGDRILKIDTLSTLGVEQSQLLTRLRGEEGSLVELTLWRPIADTTLRVQVERSMIPLPAVSAYYLLQPRRGYIRLERFGRTTMREFKEAFKALGPLDELVLDLQGNGGGLLHQATELAAFFLEKGSLIVSTKGYHVEEQRVEASSAGKYRKGRLVLLVDESSASGSEVVAGALQDWDRALIVGRPTYGKGLVQRQVVLPDESAVRITIARYHTPSGRAIQRPYRVGERDSYYAMQRERRRALEVEALSDTLPAYTTLRYGRPVYGGGGIRPDLLVEADTSGYSPLYRKVLVDGLLHDFAVGVAHTRGAELVERYPLYEDFYRAHPLEELYPELLTYLEARGVPLLSEETERSKGWILSRLFHTLSQFFYGEEREIQAVNDTGMNPALRRAEALFEGWELESKGVFGDEE